MIRDVFEDFQLDMECDLNNDETSFWKEDFEYGGCYEEDSSGNSSNESSVSSKLSELSRIMELEY